jgi:hypothetical protein
MCDEGKSRLVSGGVAGLGTDAVVIFVANACEDTATPAETFKKSAT